MRIVGIIFATIFLMLSGVAGLKFLLTLCAIVGLVVGLIMCFICLPAGVALEIFCGLMLDIILSGL